MKIKAKLWHLEGEQVFLKFDIETHVGTLPRYHQEKHSGKNIKIEAELWPPEGEQVFEQI